MREGVNPLADRVFHLTSGARLPKKLRASIEEEDLSGALKLANEWYRTSKHQRAEAAITYASLLIYRDLDDEALGVIQNTKESSDHASLEILTAELALLKGELEPIRRVIRERDNLDLGPGQLTFLAEIADDIEQNEEALELRQSAMAKGGTITAARNIYFYLRDDDPAGAADALSVAGRLAPDDPELHSAIAAAWSEAGEFERAVSSMERALDLGVDFYLDGFAYILYLAGAQEWKKALRQIRKLLEYDDEDLDWREFEATALFELGDFEKSRTKWNQLWTAEQIVDHALMVALCAKRLGDIEMELKVLRDGFETDPETVRPDLARALMRAGRSDEARKLVEQGDPDSPELQVVVALVDLDAEFSTEYFEPEDWLEVMEASLSQSKWELFDRLDSQSPQSDFDIWVELFRAIKTHKTEQTAKFGFDLQDRVVPLWDTENLEHLAWQLPDSDGFLSILGEFETRMAVHA